MGAEQERSQITTLANGGETGVLLRFLPEGPETPQVHDKRASQELVSQSDRIQGVIRA